MSRRRFLKQSAAVSAAIFAGAFSGGASRAAEGAAGRPELRTNPYGGLDFSSCRHVGSSTHIHCRSQRVLEILLRRGITHLAVSNYYPSAPLRADERQGEYFVGQQWVTRTKGGYAEEPIEWNSVIMDAETGWHGDLPESLAKKLPFEVGPPIFSEIPDEAILCPNAEHHSMTDNRGHFNSVGSYFSSGTFDVRGHYQLPKHGFPIGTGMPWNRVADLVFEKLQFADGGGLTINHPVWSGLTLEGVCDMLDYDERVLGIEVWNQSSEQINGKGWALDLWDEVLRTGRRCFGFSVSDHAHKVNPQFLGHNVLLIPAGTTRDEMPHACLKAYRQGQFYCVLVGRLALEHLSYAGGTFRVRTNERCRLRLISGQGVVSETEAQEASFTIPDGAARKHGYLRVEGRSLTDKDVLMTQPVWL